MILSCDKKNSSQKDKIRTKCIFHMCIKSENQNTLPKNIHKRGRPVRTRFNTASPPSRDWGGAFSTTKNKCNCMNLQISQLTSYHNLYCSGLKYNR